MDCHPLCTEYSSVAITRRLVAALLENERHRIAQEALQGISDPKERAAAYAVIFKPKIIQNRFVVLEEDKARTREPNP